MKEEKEILDHFAQVFTYIEARNFQDVFGSRMPILFDYIVSTPAALTIPQHFLANTNISKYFADILLTFLVSRLPDLAHTEGAEGERAQTLLRLFKTVFASGEQSLTIAMWGGHKDRRNAC